MMTFIRHCASIVSLMTGLAILDMATGFGNSNLECNPESMRVLVYLSAVSVIFVSWNSID